MSVTDEIALTGAWDAVADGPGTVTFTPQGESGEWRIGATEAAPTAPFGHTVPRRQNVSLELLADERLYVKGTAGSSLTFTAEVPAA